MKEIGSEEVAVLMSVATTLAGNIASLFTMFLSVVFGALAFSATISLRNIGPAIDIGVFHASGSSLIIAFALTAFFIISFLSFQDAQQKLLVTLQELSEHTNTWSFVNEKTKSVFKPHAPPVIGNLGRESIGFIIGGVMTVIAFLWISNVYRAGSQDVCGCAGACGLL